MINYNEAVLVQQNDEKIAKEAKELNQEQERKRKKQKEALASAMLWTLRIATARASMTNA